MKKRLVFVGMAMLVVAVVLSGCEEQKSTDDASKFIGTWTNLENEDTENIWTFYDNDTMKAVANYLYSGLNNTAWSYWEIKDGQLCSSDSPGQYESFECLDYEFSNDDTTLTFTYWYLEGKPTVALNKV